MKPIGFRMLLKQYRMAAGLTQEALAERANLSARAISDLERGIYRTPRYDTLNMLASAMNLSADQRAVLFAAARPTLPPRDVPEAPEVRLQVLPFPPAPIIGREEELALGLQLLLDREPPLSVEKGKEGPGSDQVLSEAKEQAPRPVRLLTVSGPGGVGKTRLALQIAHEVRDHFADGLAYVDLTPIRDPSLVPQMVAQTLGLGERPASAFPEDVRTFLRDKQFLLILDNFEQVLAAAPFVAELLMFCPRLQVLVTSRTPLHLRAEHHLPLGPLTLEAAWSLFYERAQSQGIKLPVEHTSYMVAAICEQVDKLPLAIELAAAHARVLSLSQLLERLADRLRFLRGSAPDLPARQRTMLQAIAWSYDLLDAEPGRAFRALSAFAGGFTLSAAEAFCYREEVGAPNDVLPSILALADASLIQVKPSAEGVSRYQMLEVIREYASEQLRASGDEELYLRRHAEYFTQLVEELRPGGPGFDRLEGEHDNIRAALAWSLGGGAVEVGLRLAAALGWFWFVRGHFSEGRKWLEAALAKAERVPPDGEQQSANTKRFKARILSASGRLAMKQTAYADAWRFSEESLALWRELGDQRGVAASLLNLGHTAREQGNSTLARSLMEESLGSWRVLGDKRGIAEALQGLGVIAVNSGHYDQAAALMEESLEVDRELGDNGAVANALQNLAGLAITQGDYGRAALLIEDSVTLALREGSMWLVADAQLLEASLALKLGDYGRSEALLAQCLPHYHQNGDLASIASCLALSAELVYARTQLLVEPGLVRGDTHASLAQAARLLGAVQALRAATGAVALPADPDNTSKTLAVVKAALDEDTFSMAWSEGKGMTVAQAVAQALTTTGEPLTSQFVSGDLDT